MAQCFEHPTQVPSEPPEMMRDMVSAYDNTMLNMPCSQWKMKEAGMNMSAKSAMQNSSQHNHMVYHELHDDMVSTQPQYNTPQNPLPQLTHVLICQIDSLIIE